MNIFENIEDYNYYLKILIEDNKVDYSSDLNYWSNIPINDKSLHLLYRAFEDGYKLIDLGCGCGNILRFANNIGYDVTGIEFNNEYEEYLKPYNYYIQDITLLDNDFYEKFDVIYIYKPLKYGFKEYVNHIVSNMRIGSYIITPTYMIENINLKYVDIYMYERI